MGCKRAPDLGAPLHASRLDDRVVLTTPRSGRAGPRARQSLFLLAGTRGTTEIVSRLSSGARLAEDDVTDIVTASTRVTHPLARWGFLFDRGRAERERTPRRRLACGDHPAAELSGRQVSSPPDRRACGRAVPARGGSSPGRAPAARPAARRRLAAAGPTRAAQARRGETSGAFSPRLRRPAPRPGGAGVPRRTSGPMMPRPRSSEARGPRGHRVGGRSERRLSPRRHGALERERVGAGRGQAIVPVSQHGAAPVE